MSTRRHFLHAACCAACAALAGSSGRSARAAEAPREVAGPGYTLRFIGAQRETIMMGRRESRLDLRSLQGTAHLFGMSAPLCPTAQVALLRDGVPDGFRTDRNALLYTRRHGEMVGVG